MLGKLGQEAGSHQPQQVVVRSQELLPCQATLGLIHRLVLGILAVVVVAYQVVRDMLHHLVAAHPAPSLHLLQNHRLAQHSYVFFDLQQWVLVRRLVREMHSLGPLAGWGHIALAGIARGPIDHWEGSLAVGLT